MLMLQSTKERKLVRLASCCTCLAFLSLICAAILPMFVVTSLKGHGKLLIAEFDVDLAIGAGLWKRNVCSGRSRPDEDVLAKFGLSCQGTLQTGHCDDDNLSDKEEDRCERYALMQGMESLAIFSTFVSSFLGALARRSITLKFLRGGVRFGSIVALGVSVAASSAVITLVKKSDMVENQEFSCSNMFGAQLCHGYGPSFALQWAAIGELLVALTLHIILLFVPMDNTTTSNQYVQAPLLQQPVSTHGVVISGPNRTQTMAAEVL